MSRPFIRTWIRRSLVGSTSDLARERLLAVNGEPPLPLLVWTRRQTRGRGRGPNSWWSDAGSLLFTIAIDPTAHGLQIEHHPRLALATAVAVVDALAPLGLTQPPGIRWPNDIEAGGRKLGGILPERLDTPRGVRLLIGVGLNVATNLANAPHEVRAMAASLADLRASPTPPGEVERLLLAILAEMTCNLDRLAHDDPALALRWANLDTLRGCPVRVDLGARIVSGLGWGIDEAGALLLTSDAGPLRLLGGRVLREP